MAYNVDYLNKVSSGANDSSNKVWIYNGTSGGSNETNATIAASGYFNNAQQSLTSGEETGLFAVGDVVCVNGNDSTSWYSVSSVTTNVALTAGTAGSVDTSQLVDSSVTTAKLDADAVTNAKLADNAVSLENLDAGITPSHIVVYADQPTTVGGAAAEAFTVSGVLATDLAFVQVVDDGTAGVTVLQAVCTSNTLTVTFSANPGADTVFNYQILRAAS